MSRQSQRSSLASSKPTLPYKTVSCAWLGSNYDIKVVRAAVAFRFSRIFGGS